MKVTKTMLTRAENKHFNTETAESLDKSNALQYLYAKQHGDKKLVKYYDKNMKFVKKMAEKLEAKKDRKKSVKKAVGRKLGTAGWMKKETDVSMY